MAPDTDFVVGAFYKSIHHDFNVWQLLRLPDANGRAQAACLDRAAGGLMFAVERLSTDNLVRIAKPADWPLDQNNDLPERKPQVGEFWNVEFSRNDVQVIAVYDDQTFTCLANSDLGMVTYTRQKSEMVHPAERPEDWPL